MTKDKLYEISKKLYQENIGLENHLSRCTNELFNLQDKIILYDLTNTYFEGRMPNSQKARFGRSKEKRSNARLIVLAVIINSDCNYQIIIGIAYDLQPSTWISNL